MIATPIGKGVLGGSKVTGTDTHTKRNPSRTYRESGKESEQEREKTGIASDLISKPAMGLASFVSITNTDGQVEKEREREKGWKKKSYRNPSVE